MIQGIADVFYFVADMDRAAAFYRDVVGLGEPTYASGHWTAFAAGGTTFALHWTGGSPVAQAQGDHGSRAGATVTFVTDDVAATIEALRAQGAPILQEPQMADWGTTATAADPDGNVFKLKG